MHSFARGRGHGRPARERHWCGMVTDEKSRPQPARSRRPCPSLSCLTRFSVKPARLFESPRTPGFSSQPRFFNSTPMETSDAASMSDIREAANSFGSPASTAIHPAVALQVNTAAKNPVQTSAAIHAQPNPRNIRTPHTAERNPNVPPEMRAVFAPEGFDKNPATPHTKRKIPKPTNQRPVNFIHRSFWFGSARVQACSSLFA
jgi:hypothetical protein